MSQTQTHNSTLIKELREANKLAHKSDAKRARRRQRRMEQGKSKLKDLTPALAKLSIPRNEQDQLATIVSTSGESSKVQNYVACLVAPKLFRSRVPDAYARKTALFGSVQTIDVMANFSGAVDDGRFALLVNPHLGSLSNVDKYKVALVDSSTGWPTDFTQSSAFVSMSNNRDVRLDLIAQRLTQPPLGLACFVNNSNGTAASPFSANLADDGGYGLPIQYNAAASTFTAPPGTYFVAITLASQTSLSQPFAINVTAQNGYWDPFNSTLGYLDGTNTDVSNVIGVWRCGPASPAAAGGTLTVTTNATATLGGQCSISFVTTFDDDQDVIGSHDYGDLAEYRPVACSALFTCATSPLITGGMVAGALLPSGTALTQYFGTNVSAIGNLEAWENLSQLPGSYNGPIQEGSYAWYSPADNDDVSMFAPSDAVSHRYPTLCIAGQLSPNGTALTGNIMVGRLEVATVYEGITTSQLYDSQMMLGSQAIMDAVNRHLAVQPHSMQNKKHTDFQRSVIKRAPPSAKGNGMPWVAQALGSAIPWAVNNRSGLSEAVGMLGDLASAIF